MPVTATFHYSRVKGPPMYRPPQRDVAADIHAAKANELLNLRSKNINHILDARQKAGDPYKPISLPPSNPRVDELHKELGIDKVVLVKVPFQIDTTPGAPVWKAQPAAS